MSVEAGMWQNLPYSHPSPPSHSPSNHPALPTVRKFGGWIATVDHHTLQPEPLFQKGQKLTVSLCSALAVLPGSLRLTAEVHAAAFPGAVRVRKVLVIH